MACLPCSDSLYNRPRAGVPALVNKGCAVRFGGREVRKLARQAGEGLCVRKLGSGANDEYDENKEREERSAARGPPSLLRA